MAFSTFQHDGNLVLYDVCVRRSPSSEIDVLPREVVVFFIA
ncbi:MULTISPECIES: hypothetical protein [unclassified Picosynechococcus]|nr:MULTISPECIES: hypothetical protein [unclassified Picosynechococcus]